MSSGLLGNPFASLGIDFYGFFLPWIFTFAIVYGLLSKANIFGGDNKRISAALAFVVAFFVTAVGGPQLALFFTSIFGGASMFLAGILVIILFLAMLGRPIGELHKNMWAVAAVVILGIMLFLASSGQFVSVAVIGPDIAGLVFWLIIIVVAIYFVMGKNDGHEGGGAGGKQG